MCKPNTIDANASEIVHLTIKCEIMAFGHCEIFCWRRKWNEINPRTSAGISHGEAIFHKSRKGFVSLKKRLVETSRFFMCNPNTIDATVFFQNKTLAFCLPRYILLYWQYTPVTAIFQCHHWVFTFWSCESVLCLGKMHLQRSVDKKKRCDGGQNATYRVR